MAETCWRNMCVSGCVCNFVCVCVYVYLCVSVCWAEPVMKAVSPSAESVSSLITTLVSGSAKTLLNFNAKEQQRHLIRGCANQIISLHV